MGTLNDYRDRPHWSYSALQNFLCCSLQFAFKRIYKLPPAFTSVALVAGSVFHRVAEWIGMGRMEGKLPTPEQASELFADLWSRQLVEDKDIRFDEETTAESCLKQGRDMIACLVANTDPTEKVLAINQPLAVPLVDAEGKVLEKPLIGEIDYIIERDGQPVLGDWKTSARRWPKFKANHELQPTVLLYAHQQATGTLPQFEYTVIVKNKTPVLERHTTTRKADDFHRMVELVKLAEDMVKHEHFCPNEQGYFCASCPYQDPCAAWHRNRSRLISTAA